MAACDVLYFDPAHAGSGDGWRPCTAAGNVWTDPDQVLRFVCHAHRRQLTALHAAGLADRIRWGRPGQPTGAAPSIAGLGGVMKLVRDRIPELVAANGEPGTFQAATEDEYALYLRAKLLAEAQEAATAAPAALVEELGDVLQVLYALAELAGATAAEIECARTRKARTHGTYTRRLLWQPPPEPSPGRDTRSRRQAEPRAHPAPHPTEATR